METATQTTECVLVHTLYDALGPQTGFLSFLLIPSKALTGAHKSFLKTWGRGECLDLHEERLGPAAKKIALEFYNQSVSGAKAFRGWQERPVLCNEVISAMYRVTFV